MTVITASRNQRKKTANGTNFDIDKLRALIAKNLDIDIKRVTDDAHFVRDLDAD